MKARILLVVMILMFAGLACNMPASVSSVSGTGTPTGSLDVLTAAAQTAQAGQTQPAATLNAPTNTPGQATATSNATPTNTGVPPTNTPIPCDIASFIQDVTIPDGSKIPAGQTFTKTWRLKNIGTCTWNANYAIVFVSGDAMGAPAVVNLPGDVAPNDTVDLSVNMKAPQNAGRYTGYWTLRNSSGVMFGVSGINQPFFVQIQVVTLTLTPTITSTPTITQTPTVTKTPQPSGLIYNFTANMCQAQWLSQSDKSGLPCPGTTNDPKGYVQQLTSPVLETGTTENNPVLLTVPDATASGAITGQFPAIAIQNGYRFQAAIGCLSGAAQCNVKYQINYVANGQVKNLKEYLHSYGGTVQGVDIDLSSLAGQQVQIVLVVLVNGPTTGQQAVWVYPRIVKP